MSSGKHKKYHFTFQTVIRIIIFSLLLFFLIYYLSDSKNTSLSDTASVLGAQINISGIYDKIPEGSRHQLENINTSPAAKFLEQKYIEILKLTDGFPQKQIKEVQKILLKNAYENMLKNIDKP